MTTTRKKNSQPPPPPPETNTEPTAPPVTIKPSPDLNVHQRLRGVMSEVGYVQKTGQMDQRAGGYTYVRHDDVTREVRYALLKWGVLPRIEVTDIVNEILVGQKTYQGNTVETKAMLTRVIITLTFVNVDKPDDTHSIAGIPGMGLDPQDKAPGKALSYAMKYALQKGLLLETGEDEESRTQLPGQETNNVRSTAEPPKANSEKAKSISTVWDWACKSEIGRECGKAGAVRAAIEACPETEFPAEGTQMSDEHWGKLEYWASMHEEEPFEIVCGLNLSEQNTHE